MKLNKTKVYSLEDLTSEERKELSEVTKNPYVAKDCELTKYLIYDNKISHWQVGEVTRNETTNAKELFYTLENIQVDCRELSEEQIKEMADVFEANGYNYYDSEKFALNRSFDSNFLICRKDVFYITNKQGSKAEITYDKFMELFGSKENKSGWYKHTNGQYKNWLVYYDFKNNVRYGFDANGYWSQDNGADYKAYLELATEKEVENRLIEEAKRRGFKEGAVIDNSICGFGNRIKEKKLKSDKVSFNELGHFCIGQWVIMKDGVWAEVVEEKPEHYSHGIDTFERMEANCTKEECLAFAKGNIDKYNWREKGQDLEDYKKIVSYANWAIKLLKDEK